MPTFTLELWRVLETTPDIGLNQYPIFDPDYRKPLNDKIIAHYYNREIGHETVQLFTFAMQRRMNEIMPYYNDLLKSARMEYDPLKTMDIRTIASGESVSEGSAESTNTGDTTNKSGSRAVSSMTPQVQLSGRGDYATSATDTNGENVAHASSKDESASSTTDNTNSDSHVTGYQGSPAQLISDYRSTLLNIDMLIIDELSDLFMGVWDNGDSYLNPAYPFTPFPSL